MLVSISGRTFERIINIVHLRRVSGAGGCYRQRAKKRGGEDVWDAFCLHGCVLAGGGLVSPSRLNLRGIGVFMIILERSTRHARWRQK